MLLGGEESEIGHVRCVRYRSASGRFRNDSFLDTVREPNLVRSESPEPSRKKLKHLARANKRRNSAETPGHGCRASVSAKWVGVKSAIFACP